MRIASVLATALLATGCSTLGGGAGGTTVALEARSGSSVTGTITLTDTRQGLRLRGEIRGLAPGSEHGFHIHDKERLLGP
ncbi:MAG: hypothetical protein U1F11_12415 [Steroidobacteraceae bacterium]